MPSVMERSGSGVLSRSRAKTVTNGNSLPHSEEEGSDEEHAHDSMIRVGEDYQAQIPEFKPDSPTRYNEKDQRSMLVWCPNSLLSDAMSDTAMAPPPDPPQQPQTDPVPPSQEPPSGPRKRTSKSAALPQPQPIEATVTQPEVSFEGWHKQWESGPQGLPSADVKWLKEDADRGLFKNLTITRRKILKDDRMWFHPPEIPGVVVGGGVPSADAFFRSRVFFWRPVGVWGYSLRCPRSGCPGGKAAFLYRCGYGNTVRHICDMTGWYSMLTELLACNACRKAAKGSQENSIGRFLAWDAAILKQLTPAHQAVFPAILTPRRGVDKQVVRLMRDRTEGNTMVKVWRQVQEGHCEEYQQRKDLYTTLLCQLSRPGSIMSALGHQCQKPPTRRELPSPRLLRKAYLIYEAEHIEDYRTQIMSTFGKVLKYDSTRKICKKLSGHGRGTAEWCTNVANELGQVLMSVFTCEESLTCLKPMADGLMERYRRAGEGPPELMYVNRGCCRVHGVSLMEHLFSDWADSGMMVRLDIFHWIKRFDAAVRTDHHPKYALFKSALSAAVFSYNKDDMALLIQAIRAGNTTRYASLTDAEMIEIYVSKEDLRHFVRRITLGAQESFLRVQTAINSLKGAAGLDENQVPLFKDAAAIDRVWENQQKHLECIQDPPGRDMYTVMKVVTRNGVRMPYYTTVRGSNSLEGIHFFLPRMIPGPHCAAVPFQVYLLSGIARWNSDREAGSVKGQKGRKNRVYMSPLIDRLNKRCQDLFGEVEEINFRPPVPAGEERIGLEYLFAQSSQPFSASEHYAQTRETLQTVEDKDDEEEVAADTEESTQDDVGYATDNESDDLAPLKRNLVLTDQVVASEHDPCVEDVCGPNHLPGYQHVEKLSSILVEPQPVFLILRGPALPPQLPPPPVFLPPPALPQARSTIYRWKKTELGATQYKKQKHTCTLCGQSTQGHRKYKKKSYCQQSKLSTSKGLTGKTFDNIADFHMAVDELLASQSQAP